MTTRKSPLRVERTFYMFEKIKNLIPRFFEWRARKKMVRAIIKRYEMQGITNKILEQWITQRILDGQEGRRNELIQKQKEIEETKLFIAFLKKII